LQDYGAALEAFRSRNTDVVALSPMTGERMDALAEKLKLGFPLLSDPGNAYARSLDLVFAVEPAVRDVYRTKGLDLSEYNGDESWELPVTAVFVCDEDRKVLYAWTESDYTRRPGSEELLAVLDGRS